MFKRLKSEFAYLAGALRTLRRVRQIPKTPNRTYCDVVEELAAQFGDKPALLSADENLSFREYNGRGNRYARWTQANGVRKGETVALLMFNRPEFLATWLGVTRAGGVCALLNTSLTGKGLAHCLNIVKPKHIIVGADLLDALETAKPMLEGGPTIWVNGKTQSGYERIDKVIDSYSDAPLSADERPLLHINDPCLFIYTSGTTGLPKAANINHYRVQSIMNGFSGAMNARADDRIYVSLPLYHTSGGVLAVGALITVGGSVVLRDKFSAREFWDDIVKYDCTMFQYVGELCRYLLNSPTNPNEINHRIRLCCGNGLRPDIWIDFRNRFRLKNILEFYGATEGNVALFNFDSKPGAVGRIPKWAEKRFITKVVRFDIEKEEPVRGADGLCIRCDANEIGEVIGMVLDDPKKPNQRFEGYADKAATQKKILRDVFEKGDIWFRTGDLMRRDELGYFYFVDRIGDTFRWKGENVATSQVSEAVTVYPGIKEANVYGVTIPGKDGRAGMAALSVEDGFDIAGLHHHVRRQLPDFAQPLFLRIQDHIETTGTFKQRKVELVAEGFDPDKISDPIYFADPQKQRYVKLDQSLFDAICKGEIRL